MALRREVGGLFSPRTSAVLSGNTCTMSRRSGPSPNRAAGWFSPQQVTTERRGREILSSQVLADHPLLLSVFGVIVPPV